MSIMGKLTSVGGRVVIAATFLATQLLIPIAASSSVGAAPDTRVVTLCHATASNSNPYNQITTDAAGAFNGHYGNSHQNGNDIIPPFTYQDQQYSQNWDAQGQAIWNNQCRRPVSQITVNKILDRDGNVQTTNDRVPGGDWRFRIAGPTSENVQTGSNGSTETERIRNGSYSVTEQVQPGFQIIAARCTGAENNGAFNPQTNAVEGITATNNRDIQCTFVNSPSQETGRIQVVKDVEPDNDNGQFNLLINGQEYATNVGDGGSTGWVTVPAGTNSVSEVAGSSTDLNDYDTTINCRDGGNEVAGTARRVQVNADSDVLCVITNTAKPQVATVLAYKVACSAEEYLPNWSGGQPGATNGPVPNIITETTAQEYVDQSQGNCRFTDGWDFQWGFHSQGGNSGVSKYPGDFVGPAPTGSGYGDWKNFSSTASGPNPATVEISDLEGATRLWIRENLKDGYVPFVNPPGPLRSDNISAEIYCHTDILNYDNFDRVDNLELGGTYHCVAFNAPNKGTLIVEKQSQPEDPQNFGFRVESQNGFFEQFFLDDDGNNNNQHSNTQTLANLVPGTYQIREQNVDGWNLAGVRCAGERVNPDNNTVWVEVVAGEELRCVFTNQKDGQITVIKNAVPNDPQDFRFRISRGQQDINFLLDDDPNSNRPNQRTFDVRPGNYTIAEGPEAEWILHRIDCGDAQAERDGQRVFVRVNPGQHVSCEFRNVKRGSITIIKNARPESDQEFNFEIGRGDDSLEFSLTDEGDDENSRAFENVRPGNYWVNEELPKGWELRNIECNVDFERDGTMIYFRLRPGGTVVCEYNNLGRGSITVVKNAFPLGSDQTFDFRAGREGSDKRVEFTLDGNYNPSDGHQNRKSFDEIRAGVYRIREARVDGWDLTHAYCYDRNDFRFGGDVQTSLNHNYDNDVRYNFNGQRIRVELEPGQDLVCRFINVERGDVKVTKFHDENQNGRFDEGEETLEGWEINLMSRRPHRNGDRDDIPRDTSSQALEETYEYSRNRGRTQTQTTGEDGMTTFEDVRPFPTFHKVSENQQEGWVLSNVYCEKPEIRIDRPDVRSLERNGHRHDDNNERAFAFVLPGRTTECFVGNYPEPELEITKFNNRPEPTIVGDTVTYTVIVENPDNSSCVFGYPVDKNCAEEFEEEYEGVSLQALIDEYEEEEEYTAVTVTDLPPSGFTYVPGSYTADSNVRGDLKAQGITPEPGYASPGNWSLTSILSNFLVPGEVVTLTYQAVIQNVVSDGTHDDSAFASGFTGGGNQIYANEQFGSNPFVGTDVEVVTPLESQGFVQGTQILAETGFPAFVQIGLGMSLAGAGLLVAGGDRFKKMFKKLAKPLAGFLLAFGLIMAISSPASALDSWTMNVIQPPTATNSSSFNLSYQVATIDDSNTFKVTVSQNGSDLQSQTITTPFGNSKAFPITFPNEGTHTYDVTAEVTAGGNTGETMTKSVSIVYDASTPASPTYDGKTRDGNTWTVSFTVPAGSSVETVQIFASTSSTFTADSSTLVGEVTATPGTQQSFSYTAPDSAERFFAVRTVDTAQNPSALVGDEEVIVTTVPGQTTAPGAGGAAGTNGEVLAEQDSQDGSENGQDGDEGQNEDGDEDEDNNSATIWIIIALIAAGVAGAIYWQSRSPNEE